MAIRATAQLRVGLGDAGGADSVEDEHPASAMTAREAATTPPPRIPSLRTRPG